MEIGIVGLGLIGGCLGIDLSRRGHGVTGIARHEETCRQALERGIVQRAGSDFRLLGAAEVVFICTPIAQIGAVVEAIAPYLDPEAIVTDVGSVKAPVIAAARPHWPRFLGGHPMAGKAEAGLEAAEAHLFRQRPYVITPGPDTPAADLDILKSLVADLESRLYLCDPTDHDQAVAWISHLPVMVSSSLIHACLQEPEADRLRLAQALASSGFRDTSRVGGGPPELGLMMARYNREALLNTLAAYQRAIAQVSQLIQTEDWSALERHLQESQTGRLPFVAPRE
ncbi:arogenate dehydrogenase [filamentous cyanobacterium CCP5]|nr:arogenate dehydrogenase [filamentous cyanobacterium CCP5]